MSDNFDSDDEPTITKGQQSFGQRHGITILTSVLFGMLGLVMLIQVAC